MEASLPVQGGVWCGVRRAVMVVAAAALFIGAASLIKPDPQDASAAAPIGVPRVAAPSTDHPRGWRLLGTLEGREHVVKCWGTNLGVRYSVHALDGRLLQDDLPADEVYRAFPDMELHQLRADPPQGDAAPVLLHTAETWRSDATLLE